MCLNTISHSLPSSFCTHSAVRSPPAIFVPRKLSNFTRHHSDFISPPLGAVTSGGAGERKGQQSVSQAEAERQQILNEMKKKTPLLTDSSWIRQRPAPTVKESDIPPMRRYSREKESWCDWVVMSPRIASPVFNVLTDKQSLLLQQLL